MKSKNKKLIISILILFIIPISVIAISAYIQWQYSQTSLTGIRPPTTVNCFVRNDETHTAIKTYSIVAQSHSENEGKAKIALKGFIMDNPNVSILKYSLVAIKESDQEILLGINVEHTPRPK